MESKVPRSKGGILKAGRVDGNPGACTCANIARKDVFPVLFSPTRRVRGRRGMECRSQKLLTFSSINSIDSLRQLGRTPPKSSLIYLSLGIYALPFRRVEHRSTRETILGCSTLSSLVFACLPQAGNGGSFCASVFH